MTPDFDTGDKQDIKPCVVPSIEEVINEFLRKFNSTHTVRRYKKVLQDFFLFSRVLLLTDLADIRFDKLLDLIRDYSGRTKSNRSRLNTLNIIRSFFNYLIFTYNYPKNPVSKQIFDMKQERNTSSTPSLSEVDIIKLLDCLKEKICKSQKDYRDYLLISTMLITSLRISEAIQISLDQIKCDNITGHYYVEIYQKNNRVRKVLIPGKLLQDYREYGEKFEITSFIFTSMKNNVSSRKRLTQQGCYKIVRKKIKEYLNKDKISNHSLRKSFIELANKRRLSPVSIAKATGHSTLQMIKYYDTSEELLDNATSDIAKVLLY